MISIDRCKEILGESMPESEVLLLRESLYAMVESILDNYLEEFATINICTKQLSIAESQAQGKAQKDMGSIVRSTDVESMLNKESAKL